MTSELLIDVSDFETRVALRTGGALQELHVERSDRGSLTGNIYMGRVDRVVPGMQAAFVDVGLDRFGFLHVRETLGARREDGGDGAWADMLTLVCAGQRILVQVAKDPVGGKGVRLTMHLAIASRSLVMLPHGSRVAVSQRIDDEAERERLRQETAAAALAEGFEVGFIARTVAHGASFEQLRADIGVLRRIWERIAERSGGATSGELIYEELPVHTRAIRDFASVALDRVIVNDVETHRRLSRYAQEHLPDLAHRVVLQEEQRPALFERYGVEDELRRALAREVRLKSGGYLVIEPTEAMTTIDVNSGTALGARNLEETALRTNLEAANAIPRQLRLRNIGGIVVVDFIDMEDEANQRAVMRALEKGIADDPGKVRLMPFSPLGLVEMSRKRARPSLAQVLCEPCTTCDGTGATKRPESTCYEILRFIRADALERPRETPGEYCVRASERVVERLLDEDAGHLADLSDELGRPIRLQVEPSCAPGEFDVVLNDTGTVRTG